MHQLPDGEEISLEVLGSVKVLTDIRLFEEILPRVVKANDPDTWIIRNISSVSVRNLASSRFLP